MPVFQNTPRNENTSHNSGSGGSHGGGGSSRGGNEPTTHTNGNAQQASTPPKQPDRKEKS